MNGLVTTELSPQSIVETFGEKFTMKAREDGCLYLLHKHKCYAQVQGQMAILRIEWYNFVVHGKGI